MVTPYDATKVTIKETSGIILGNENYMIYYILVSNQNLALTPPILIHDVQI